MAAYFSIGGVFAALGIGGEGAFGAKIFVSQKNKLQVSFYKHTYVLKSTIDPLMLDLSSSINLKIMGGQNEALSGDLVVYHLAHKVNLGLKEFYYLGESGTGKMKGVSVGIGVAFKTESNFNSVFEQIRSFFTNNTPDPDFVPKPLMLDNPIPKKEALGLFATWAKEQSPYFPNISPDEFITQTTELIEHSYTIHQGNETYFCWAAAFSYYMLDNDPKGMIEALISLYDTGIFSYQGKFIANTGEKELIMKPSDSARQAINSPQLNKYEGLSGKKITQMLLLTLVESEQSQKDKYDNSYKHVLDSYLKEEYMPGRESSAWAGRTINSLNALFQKFGIITQRKGSFSTFSIKSFENYPQIKALKNALAGSEVIVYVNSSLFKKENSEQIENPGELIGTHYIRMKNLVRQGNVYTFDYWDYGSWKNKVLSTNQLSRSVFGMLALEQ